MSSVTPSSLTPQDPPAGTPPTVPATRLLVVVVNYRTPGLTIDCLASLAAEARSAPGMRVIVVENGSGDESAGAIREAIRDRDWTDWAELVISDRNLGFSGGNNLGIARGEPAEYVLLLNSDTVVHPGCLQGCLDAMERSPRVGALSCRVLNSDGTIQNVSRRFPTPARMLCSAFGLPWKLPRLFGWADTEYPGWDRSTSTRDVDWLGGAFLFLRSSAFPSGVRLDEDFFFYGEDMEICHRLRRRGFVCRYEPVGSVTHLGGGSSDPTRLPQNDRSEHHWRARYLVQRKCHGGWAARGIRALDLFLIRIRIIRARLRGKPTDELEALRDKIWRVSN